MRAKAVQTIARWQMIPPGSSVTAAVSGGADSVALAHLLKQLRQELDFSLSVCHINHGLRGAESDRDEDFVRALCEQWQLPLTVFREDAAGFARKNGMSVEEAGRQIRYGRLREAADGGLIATAHTRSDDVETFLINLARGTGLRGLCGIEPVREDIVRPLLYCTREEVECYLRENGLSWVTDSSNLSDEYTRNRIRHQLTPQIMAIQPAFYEVFGRMKEHLRQDEEYLTGQAQALLSAARTDEGLAAQRLTGQAPSVLVRALKIWLGEQGIGGQHTDLEKLQTLLTRKSGRIQLHGGWCVQLQKGVLRLGKESAPLTAAPLPVEEGIPFDGPLAKGVLYRINYEQFKNLQIRDCNILKNAIDCDKIYGKIFLRNKIEGDMLRPVRRGVRKPLRKWWNELGVPPQMRDKLPVLADEKGPLWAARLGVDERVSADKESKTVLLIKIEEVQP